MCIRDRIFSDDAPTLETALHHALENKKVNMINGRKEFFNVTLEEIEDCLLYTSAIARARAIDRAIARANTQKLFYSCLLYTSYWMRTL